MTNDPWSAPLTIIEERRYWAGQGDKHCCAFGYLLNHYTSRRLLHKTMGLSTQDIECCNSLVRCQGLVPPGSCGTSFSLVADAGGTVKDGDKLRQVCFTRMALW